MAEGASTEDSNEDRREVMILGSTPSQEYPPTQLDLNINNNQEGLKVIHSADTPIIQVNGENTEDASAEVDTNSKVSSDDSGSSSESSRRHSKSSSLPHGVKLCPEGSSGGQPGTESPETTGSEEKWVKLEEELRKAHEDLQAKDDEVEKLKGIRQLVEDELQDLTSSLFVVISIFSFAKRPRSPALKL